MVDVVKIGGSLIENEVLDEKLNLLPFNHPLILIHGGGRVVNTVMEKYGKKPQTYTSVSGIKSRRTDKETIEIYAQTISYLTSLIVNILQNSGVRAVGLSGTSVIEAKRKILMIKENGKRKIIRDDYTGKIMSIDNQILLNLLHNDYYPIIGALARGLEGEMLNIDGDMLAAFIANEIKSKNLYLLTDTNGFMIEREKIDFLSLNEEDYAIKHATGGMVRKLKAAFFAAENGIKVFIGNDLSVKRCTVIQ